MTDLERLLELRKKATQGPSRFPRNDDGTTVEECDYHAAVVAWFDLPSTQAMLEAGEGK